MDGDWILVNADQMVMLGTEAKKLTQYGKANGRMKAARGIG
ncbi:MAG: hypothetical protein ACRCXD_03230 [Luteolibacter sp.]